MKARQVSEPLSPSPKALDLFKPLSLDSVSWNNAAEPVEQPFGLFDEILA